MAATLEQIFGSADDERVVLSVCAVPCTTGSAHWQLIHGSLLIVPSACAETSWATWRQAERRDYGVGTGLLPAGFVIDGGDWLMARSVLDLGDAETWISKVRASVDIEAPAEITLPAIANLPQLAVTLHPPTALIRVLPGIAAASGSLLSSLVRPAQALLWRSPTDVRFPEPDTVTLEGTQTFLPSRDLTGIHITPPSVDPAIATPAGLLVGRAERRAWIRESRGTGDFDSFLVELGWEPARISLADLEITHEEFLDGELVSAMRIRIEDLDTSEVDGKGRCTVAVMTIGRSVTHGVSLHTADGELLDRTGPYPLAERIEATLTIDGTELPPVVIGRTDPPPPLDERMRRSEQMATDLEDVIRNGVQARIIADRAQAITTLESLLAGARGELLILDRYFGQDTEDWRLLDDVSVPVRVLTGKMSSEEPRIAAQVTARFRRKAPLHERIYLWNGGGLALGGSPTTFGQSPIRITRLRAAETDEWRQIFESEWESPFYNDVPQTTGG